jgi:hypothetical protein
MNPSLSNANDIQPSNPTQTAQMPVDRVERGKLVENIRENVSKYLQQPGLEQARERVKVVEVKTMDEANFAAAFKAYNPGAFLEDGIGGFTTPDGKTVFMRGQGRSVHIPGVFERLATHEMLHAACQVEGEVRLAHIGQKLGVSKGLNEGLIELYAQAASAQKSEAYGFEVDAVREVAKKITLPKGETAIQYLFRAMANNDQAAFADIEKQLGVKTEVPKERSIEDSNKARVFYV